MLDLEDSGTPERLEQFARWRDSAVATVGADLPDDRVVEAERDVVEMQHYLADRLDAATPDDDNIFGALRCGRLTIDGSDRPLDVAESLTILRQVFIGGIETTTKALAETMIQLASRPDVFTKLASDAELRRRVVEESLRMSSPAQGILRVVTGPTVLDGVALAEGDRVFVMFAAANRDGDSFEHADTFDATRRGLGRHLSFGKGTHVCLGAALARIEMNAALERLSARVDYRLQDRPISYNPSFLLRGPMEVHIDVEVAAQTTGRGRPA